MVNLVDIGGIVTIILVLVFIALLLGFKWRKTPVLRMFGMEYFTFEIINEAGMSKYVNRTTKDFKVHGKVILFQYESGWYKIQEDRLFFRKRIPSSIYRYGNPMALNVMDSPDNEIAVWDEDKKTMVTVKMSAQELRDAIESKVVHDLNKFTFSKTEIFAIILSIVSIVISAIVLYQIYQINSQMSTLIDQINQILSHIPSINPTPTG